MAVFKCKMCGGEIEFEQGATVGTCVFCGTKQTLPRLGDDRRANLYDRANHFRRNNDFDKAAGIYETILAEDPTDAEAYWSLVLCRYGIEYVEDPATRKRVPTVNRAQYTSIFDDENYKQALQYADFSQRSIYEEEAAAINEIQKGILAISQQEEPFDVFVCYKETDANGRRTPDSVLANDLYHQLTQEGFKVFFSRITLEDKLGTEFEPYIFAALNSAKVMVVLGTKPEHFNAVWVKNEWSRYLALVKESGGSKTLIPAYRDMDPYDLPDEFSHLQAQDMSKLGFMQDLIRGIKKITGADEQKHVAAQTAPVSATASNTAPLLRRAFMFLEDGEWARADELCEQVLNLEPENADAYLGKLMAELHARRPDDLKNCAEPFDNRNNFRKAVRFGDDKLTSSLNGYIAYINDRNETARLTGIYNHAKETMRKAESEAGNDRPADAEKYYKDAADGFASIRGFKDAAKLAEHCSDQSVVCQKDVVYASAVERMGKDTEEDYSAAIEEFKTIPGWRDSTRRIKQCEEEIEAIKAAEAAKEAERLEHERIAEVKRAAAKKRIIITLCAIAGLAIVGVIAYLVIQRINIRAQADELLASGQYTEAYDLLEEIGDTEALRESFMSDPQVGAYYWFGSYEQDGDNSNGAEEIRWIVLDEQDGCILLIADEALDVRRFDESGKDWETSKLKRWLEEVFVQEAFNDDEAGSLASYPFCLSVDEASTYFEDNAERVCYPSAYAKNQGVWMNDNGACRWWLRSPGELSRDAAYVSDGGRVFASGRLVNDDGIAVRPAVWLKL